MGTFNFWRESIKFIHVKTYLHKSQKIYLCGGLLSVTLIGNQWIFITTVYLKSPQRAKEEKSCNIRGIIFFSLAKIFSRKVSLTLAVEKRNFTEFACYTCSFLKPLTEWPHRCNHHCHGNTLRNMAQIFLSITDTKASCCRVVFETIGLSEGFWHRFFFYISLWLIIKELDVSRLRELAYEHASNTVGEGELI